MSLGSIKDLVADLSNKVVGTYEQLVETNVRFTELRKYTKESIDEFKRLIEKQEEKIERIERERIREETKLAGRINSLEAKLNGLSEQALHSVALEAARSIMDEKISIRDDTRSNRQNDRILTPPVEATPEDDTPNGVEHGSKSTASKDESHSH